MEATSAFCYCRALVARLSCQRGWNLNEEQQTAYARAIVRHQKPACPEYQMCQIISSYHADHELVAVLATPDHPQHSSAWQQQVDVVVAILHHSGLSWSADAALDTEDLAQMALLELVRAIHTYTYQSRFSTWAYSVVVRRIQRHIRDRSAQKRTACLVPLAPCAEWEPPTNDLDDPVTLAEGRILADLVRQVLANHDDERLSHIFDMWANNDAKLVQISTQVRLSVSRVRTLLARASLTLREHPTILDWCQHTLHYTPSVRAHYSA